MEIFLYESSQVKRGFFSFRRLIKETGLEEKCALLGETLPVKEKLPTRAVNGKVLISKIQVDERI